MSIKFSCVTLRHMSFGARVVLAVTFQQVHDAPHAKTGAQGHDKGLQSVDRGTKKLHRTSILRVFPGQKIKPPNGGDGMGHFVP